MMELKRVEEVARRLSLSVPMVYRMAQNGQLPGVVRFGKAVRIDITVLDDWVAARTVRPETGEPKGSGACEWWKVR